MTNCDEGLTEGYMGTYTDIPEEPFKSIFKKSEHQEVMDELEKLREEIRRLKIRRDYIPYIPPCIPCPCPYPCDPWNPYYPYPYNGYDVWCEATSVTVQ